jgi:hypothetical protein
VNIEEARNEAKRRWPSVNSGLYEGLIEGFVLGATWATENPRPETVREYLGEGLGYRIDRDGDGYRWIAVEAGEADEASAEVFATEQGAIRDACTDWRTNGQGDSWSEWSRQLAKDAWGS